MATAQGDPRAGSEVKALRESTVCGAFQVTAAEFADRVALRTKGDEMSMTWAEYAAKVREVAAGLQALGLKRGDTIALMLDNRPEFHWVDAAAMHLGATPFSVYNTYSAEQIEYLVADAQNAMFVTEQAYLDTVTKVKEAGGSVEHVVSVDGGDGATALADVVAQGDTGFDFDAAWRAVGPDDVLTLIYTSGTTGPPKGVQLTHSNVLAAGRAFDQTLKFPDGARVVSYLPMAHIAERSCTHYLPMELGFSTTCCPDPRQVVAYLPDVRPNWFFSVPRIYEKLKAAIEAGIAHEQDPQRKQAAEQAIATGLRKVRAEQAGDPVPDDLAREYAEADAAVLSKLRERLGLDQLEALNVGAAPTPREVIEFFHALGLPLAELWGMSETCGAGCRNRPGHIKIGTVGQPAPGTDMKLDSDGEVLIKAGYVMAAYRNLPDRTAETFTDDGYLRTGDIGEFDEDGFLRIVDRKKELIINAAGKNMSPANIEAKLKTSSQLIGQAVCIGDGRSYNVALITLDPDVAPYFAQQNGIEDASLDALARSEAVRDAVAAGVDRANEQLARVEQIKRFTILPADWAPGGDELTPTMKLKRKPIAAKYGDEIEALYAR